MTNEEKRLASLYSLNILDTDSDPNLDDLTKLASQIAGTPVALVSLVDENRQWFKSRHGLEATETPREVAFCHHAILQDEVYEVQDSREHELFKDNPLVTGEPHVIFYAGMPLKMQDGSNIGTLCVIGNEPKKLSPDQLEQLKIIGNQAIRHIELTHKVNSQNKISSMLKRLNGLSYQETDNFSELLSEYLRTGCELFGMEFGIQSHIIGDDYTVESAVSPENALEPGTKFIAKDTFCQAVMDSKETVTYSDVSKMENLTGHPCHVNMNLHSYISTPIWVDGKVYGTMSFSSTKARKSRFSNEEVAFVEILADLISKKIQFREQKEYANYAFEIMNNAPEFIGIAEAGTGHSLYHNKAFDEISGKVGAEGFKIADYHPKWALEKVMSEGIPNAMKNGTWTGETAIIDSNKKEIPVLQTITAHFNERGEPKYVSTIMQDITVQKEIEQNLIESKEKAIQASKAKSDFLANISHEIRTPMNGILGTLELLKETKLSMEQRDYLNTVRHCGNGLLSIINNVLDLSKIEAGKLEIEKIGFNLKDSVTEVYDFFKFKIKEKGLNYKLDYEENVPTLVEGDLVKIKQVLLNLVSNSLKFTEEGSIELIITSLKKGFIRFSVKDSGIGISEDKLAHVFESFSQEDASTSRKFGGTGLGLTICSQLVEAMDGNIILDSKVGVGSTFTFEIPLNEIKEITNCEVKKDSSSVRAVNFQKILVVEDNLVNQKLVMAFLKKLGLEADLASNGKEAVELTLKENYDLIFMDLQMPVMDGYEATAEILKAKKENSPQIIALTANVFEEDRQKCFDVGMNGFITKPFEFKKFEEIFKSTKKKSA